MAIFRVSTPKEPKPDSPALLFRDLRHDPSIKFLWGHQEKMLDKYANDHLSEKNLAIELPTGSGKTLVSLLIGEYRRRALGERVAFLCPNKQLCRQVKAQAQKYGIGVSLLIDKQKDYDPVSFSGYQQAKTIAITTYSGVFNTNPAISDPETIICDDAHAADGFVASMWTLTVNRWDFPQVFEKFYYCIRDAIPAALLHSIEAHSGNPAEKSQVDMVSPILTTRHNDALRELLDAAVAGTDLRYRWGLLSQNLEACLVYCSSDTLELRPPIPPTETHAPFANAKQRIFMSATLGENGDIERSFGVRKIARIPIPEGWDKRGTGRRLALFPKLSGVGEEIDVLHQILKDSERCLVLVNSEALRIKVEKALPGSFRILGAKDVEQDIKAFTDQSKAILLMANRYDGLDLPGNDCRLLALVGLPAGLGLQERYLIERLDATSQLQDRIRTRVTQAMGRCTRDEGDFSIVLLMGTDLLKWCGTIGNVRGMHPEIQAEIGFGLENSRERSAQEFVDVCSAFLAQSVEWQGADQDIQNRRNGLTKTKDATCEVLARVAPLEIEYTYQAWNGRHEEALKTAVKITEELAGGADLKPYRSFWHHLAAVSAFHSWRLSKNKGLRATAISHLDKALATSMGIRWLNTALAELSGATTMPGDVLPVQDWFLELNGLLEDFGLSGARFQKSITLAHENVKSKADKKFKQGLQTLGRLLGARTPRFEEEGSPDGLWIFGDWQAFVFEAKTDQETASGISLKTVRQAATHEQFVRSKKLIPSYTPCATVIISPRTSLHHLAQPHSEEMVYLSHEEIVRLFNEAASVFGHVRSTASTSSDEVLRDAFIRAYEERSLSMPMLKCRVLQTKLTALPVQK